MVQRTETSRAEDNVSYGAPVCTGTGSAAAGRVGSAAPPVTLDEVRTLLVLEPTIESDTVSLRTVYVGQYRLDGTPTGSPSAP